MTYMVCLSCIERVDCRNCEEYGRHVGYALEFENGTSDGREGNCLCGDVLCCVSVRFRLLLLCRRLGLRIFRINEE